MPTKLLLFMLLCLNLYANIELEDSYYVEDRVVGTSVITKDVKNDFTILSIDKESYIEKIKTKDLIKVLDKNGYKNYNSKKNYIVFILKSPIDTSFIEQKIKEYYEKNYDSIDIESIFVQPRGYLTSLPKEYIVNIRSRDFLSRDGTINIKTQENKKMFFDYQVKAKVMVYTSSNAIEKDAVLSPINCTKKSVTLDKFRDKPLQDIETASLQAKRHMPKDAILTIRDVEPQDIVKKDSIINVAMSKDGMNITFSAKALQDAKVNDIIKVQNSNGKIIKVKVTGGDMAEAE